MSGVSSGGRSGLFDSGLQLQTAAAALGVVPGATRVALYGHTPTPTANSDTWEGAGLYPFQFTASKLEILSTSAADTAAGTGARTVTIGGLDASFNPLTEVLTMNGITPVVTAGSFMRVNSISVTTTGSGNVNAGDLTLRLQGAGATQGIVRALYGYAKSAIYTVPAGFTFLVTDLLFSVAGNGNSTNVVFSFTRIGPTGLITTTNEYNTNPTTPVERHVIVGALIQATSAVTMRITGIGGAPAGGFAAFEGILFDNTKLVGM